MVSFELIVDLPRNAKSQETSLKTTSCNLGCMSFFIGLPQGELCSMAKTRVSREIKEPGTFIPCHPSRLKRLYLTWFARPCLAGIPSRRPRSLGPRLFAESRVC